MTATVFTEAEHPLAFLVSEEEFLRSRDSIVIAQNQTIVVGQVLGRIGVVANDTDVVTAAAGNTGNGTVGAVTLGTTAIDGTYTILMLTAGATAEFSVEDPNGQLVGVGKVGTAFSGPISFTITAGGAAFAVGDNIAIAVERPVGNDQWEAWTPGATDGSQIAAAIAGYPVTTGAGVTTKIAAITRQAQVRLSDLTFASGATSAQIAEATNQLLKQGIVCR